MILQTNEGNFEFRKGIFMKKLTYVVRLEKKSRLPNAPFGISVRNSDGELNTLFICKEDSFVEKEGNRPTLRIPAGLFQHLRNLQAMYNAEIRWDYESFTAMTEAAQMNGGVPKLREEA